VLLFAISAHSFNGLRSKALLSRQRSSGLLPETEQASSSGRLCALVNLRARRQPSHASNAASMAANSCKLIAVVRSSMG